MCCGNGGMYMWSNEWTSPEDDDDEEMAECIGIPASKFLWL